MAARKRSTTNAKAKTTPTRKRTPAKKAPVTKKATQKLDPQKEHPDLAGYFHIEYMGELLNLTPRRIRGLVTEGHLPKLEDGWLPHNETVSRYVAYLQERVGGRQPGAASLATAEVAAERRRKLKMENDKAAGELIEFAKVRELVNVLMSTLSNTLDGTAGRIAGGDAVLRKRLLNEHRRIRDNFANGLKNFVVAAESRRADSAAAGQDPGSMGGGEAGTAQG